MSLREKLNKQTQEAEKKVEYAKVEWLKIPNPNKKKDGSAGDPPVKFRFLVDPYDLEETMYHWDQELGRKPMPVACINVINEWTNKEGIRQKNLKGDCPICKRVKARKDENAKLKNPSKDRDKEALVYELRCPVEWIEASPEKKGATVKKTGILPLSMMDLLYSVGKGCWQALEMARQEIDRTNESEGTNKDFTDYWFKLMSRTMFTQDKELKENEKVSVEIPVAGSPMSKEAVAEWNIKKAEFEANKAKREEDSSQEPDGSEELLPEEQNDDDLDPFGS